MSVLQSAIKLAIWLYFMITKVVVFSDARLLNA